MPRPNQAKAKPRSESPFESRGLTRERVCKEALALVDEEGLEALSMRRLGTRLGVEAMSLYRHVRDKADLLDALHAAVLAEVRPPLDVEITVDWRTLLSKMGETLRSALLRHPNTVALFATRPVHDPEAVTHLRQVWALLERGGFSSSAAQKATIAVGVYAIGHTLGEAHGQPAPHLGAPNGPGEEEFRFGLEALLDGLAGHAAHASVHHKISRGRGKNINPK